MSSFRKLQLVSEEEINRLKQKQLSQYDPQLRAAAFLQSEIDDILTNKDMDVQRKTTLFQTAQQRFASLLGKNVMANQSMGGIRTQMEHDEEAAPAARALPAAPHRVLPVAQEPTEEDDVQIGQLLGTVPKSQKERAQALLNFLESKKADLTYDNMGQLVIKGQPVIGSNYQDLILSLYTYRKTFYPHGLDVFVNALRQLNVPRGIIKNTKLLVSKPPASSSTEDDNPLDLFFGTSDHPPPSKKRTHRPPGSTPQVLSVYGSSKGSSKG